jgi:segregation and condensation protein A
MGGEQPAQDRPDASLAAPPAVLPEVEPDAPDVSAASGQPDGPSPSAEAPGSESVPAAPEQLELKIVARLYGEPLLAIPRDLYIPPDALEVFLESFEGPLDLLLYLIRKQNFNILDIPMAEVTRQYLGYIDELRGQNLELAGEYLLMAALLIDIKSRMLLPVKKPDSDEEVEDPRAELARRLIEYERIKLAAQQLEQQPQLGRDFWQAQVAMEAAAAARLPNVSVVDLRGAWADILRRAKLVQHHHISREELSVREYMTRVLRELQHRRFAEFQELFDTDSGTAVVVVTFVALLELARELLIEITQAEAYAPIYVRLAYQPS